MINVIEDITKILKDDKLHDISVNISASKIVVNLICKEYISGVIPVKFDSNENEIYIPKDKLTSVIGIGDIPAIKDIMDYLEKHTSELNEICTGFDIFGRKELNCE